MNQDHFIVRPGKRIRFEDYDPAFTSHFESEDEAASKLSKDVGKLAKYQDMLYAQNTCGLLVILQGMDTAGKDGTIRHVMSGVNPQGTQVYSFKAPSAEELSHDFLWRSTKALPERGRVCIFNRSYYEEVLVVRVHTELLDAQRLPPQAAGKRIWKDRFDDINHFERSRNSPSEARPPKASALRDPPRTARPARPSAPVPHRIRSCAPIRTTLQRQAILRDNATYPRRSSR